MSPEFVVSVKGLAIGHGQGARAHVVQRDLAFDIRRGEVLAVVGASGCGKSTLLRHLIGLQAPLAGEVLYHGQEEAGLGTQDLHLADLQGDEAASAALRRRFGVMFQAGALWSAMTVGENLMLPMRLFTHWPRAECESRARFKLALVGLDGCFELEPASLSGGMRKRAAIARALALDPELLYLDEPGSGLDPVNAARLDELVLNLRHHLGTTVVMVTHEIASVFAVADRVLYLDEKAKTMTALGPPRQLLEQGPPAVREFLTRAAGGHLAGSALPVSPAGPAHTTTP